ncbi:hypothetical protein [Methylobacterium sp. SD21]|uniref:hypothetical protein n=1 Tax=Methylobacterium litchii TaxID=3138810 RepID=UPI00313CB43E
MTLKASISEMAVSNRLSQARSRVKTADIAFAQISDIGPEDVAALKEATERQGLLVVMRCPKPGAVAFQGVFPAKRAVDGYDSKGSVVKSGESGLGVHPERRNFFVSDYDMMSLWATAGGGRYRKLFASALTPTSRSWSRQAMDAVRLLNMALQSKLQHGAQDDYTPPSGKTHPGVSPYTRFAAFREGEATYLRSMGECKAYYGRWNLYWPYNDAGEFLEAAKP